MTKFTYESIILDVSYFKEGNFWNIQGIAYLTNDGPDDPAEYGDAQTEPTQAAAIDSAIAWRNLILSDTDAGYVVIHLEGNEHSCVSHKDRPSRDTSGLEQFYDKVNQLSPLEQQALLEQGRTGNVQPPFRG